MLWEQTQFTVCAASFQEIWLFMTPHPSKTSTSLQSPCLHAQTPAGDTVCVAAAPAEKPNPQLISSGMENRLLDQARRKMPSLGLISLLCLINLKLSQIYLHLITVTHLRESHWASQQNTAKIFCTMAKPTFSWGDCPWFVVKLHINARY